MRALLVTVLLLAAALAAFAGVVAIAVHGGTCSPHEGGSGCGFTLGLAVPWVISLLLVVGAIAVTLRRR